MPIVFVNRPGKYSIVRRRDTAWIYGSSWYLYRDGDIEYLSSWMKVWRPEMTDMFDDSGETVANPVADVPMQLMVADKIKKAIPNVADMIAQTLANRAIVKICELCVQGMELLAQLQKEAQALRPDVPAALDVNGKPKGEAGWTKAGLENRNKYLQKISKLIVGLDEASGAKDGKSDTKRLLEVLNASKPQQKPSGKGPGTGGSEGSGEAS